MDAKEILKQSIVVDGLFHTLLNNPPPDDTTIIDHLINGGVTAINTSVYMDDFPNSFVSCIKLLHSFYVLEDTYPDKVKIVFSSQDIDDAKKQGKLAVILGTQGASCFENDLRYIPILHRLGLRIVQLTYNAQNNLGSGVFEPHDTGLTRFGQQVISEMNRVGMLVDLSHVGYQTSLDAIAYSKKPCVFSHSSVKNLNPHKRNLTDEQIRAVAEKGGMVGLCPHSVMVLKEKGVWPTVDDYIDHIEYVYNLAGEDAVGVGSDRWVRQNMYYDMRRNEFERTLPGFYGGFITNNKHVNGFNYYDLWENFIDHLIKRGFTERQIEKFVGGNFNRVFKEVF